MKLHINAIKFEKYTNKKIKIRKGNNLLAEAFKLIIFNLKKYNQTLFLMINKTTNHSKNRKQSQHLKKI